MAKVLVLSSAPTQPGSASSNFDPWKHGTNLLIHHSAELDPSGQHQLTSDPAAADIILFAEMGECGMFAERVRAHPYYRRFPEKCFLFDSGDTIWPVLPGIYASLTEDRFHPAHTRTGNYLYIIENPYITHTPLTGEEKYLASFVGSLANHPVRKAFTEYDPSDIYVKDTSAISFQITYYGDPEQRRLFWSEYAAAMAASTFSLCPRGRSVGSVRLFESMKMGRPCVILSDGWHRHESVDWDSFSITVPEVNAAKVPEILERNLHRAREMGANARREWEHWFSEKVRFHRLTEQCLDMLGKRKLRGPLRRYYHLRHIVNPANTLWYLRSKMILHRREARWFW